MADELDLRAAADRLGVSQKTVRRWIKSGQLAATLVPGPRGDHYLIKVADVRAPRAGSKSSSRVGSARAVHSGEDSEADGFRSLLVHVAGERERQEFFLREGLAALGQEIALLRDEVAALRRQVAEHDERGRSPKWRWWQFWRR